PGMNSDCRWPAEIARLLNMQAPADRQHLRSDVEAAEELGVRYADRDRQPISILGVQVRARMREGGALQGLRENCAVKLFGEIEKTHGVTASDVSNARASLMNKGADLPVNVPMAALLL